MTVVRLTPNRRATLSGVKLRSIDDPPFSANANRRIIQIQGELGFPLRELLADSSEENSGIRESVALITLVFLAVFHSVFDD